MQIPKRFQITAVCSMLVAGMNTAVADDAEEFSSKKSEYTNEVFVLLKDDAGLSKTQRLLTNVKK